MRRDWTTIGELLYVHSEGDRSKVTRAIDALDWESANDGKVLVGPDWLEEVTYAIRRIPLAAPRRVVFSDALAPHRLYGVESQEINGVVRYYVMNMQGDFFVVCADFFPNQLAMRQARWETE